MASSTSSPTSAIARCRSRVRGSWPSGSPGPGETTPVDLKSEAGSSRSKATLAADRVSGSVELPGGGVITKQDLANMKAPRTIILPDGTSRGILDPIGKKVSNRSTLSGT